LIDLFLPDVEHPDDFAGGSMTVDASKVTSEDEAIIAEELALHERVRQAVRAAALAKAPDMSAIQTGLKDLRDEAAQAHERDLPALFQALYTQHGLASLKFDQKLPDMRAPYFAHVRLEENGKTRDVLIGHLTFIDPKHNVTIIDWRHALLAKVFFNSREGDDFEIELPGRLSQGIVRVRRVLTFEMGELLAVGGPSWTLSRPKGGAWQRGAGTDVPDLAGGEGQSITEQALVPSVFGTGTGQARMRLPEVSALLDAEQYKILSGADKGALLILGGAGSGKTTVALHRMASLAYRRPRFYAPTSMQVVVPEQGLVRLTERLLKGLDLEAVQVRTFDDWVYDEGRHILKGIPKRICQATPPGVSTIKRHPAMLKAVDRYGQRLAEKLVKGARFAVGDWLPEAVSGLELRDMPLWSRLDRFETAVKAALAAATEGADATAKGWRQDTAGRFLKDARAEVLGIDLARSTLYGDPDLHKVLQDESNGRITPAMTAELARHTQRQYVDPKAGVEDVENLEDVQAVDGGEMEQDEYAGTLDVEDYGVLLYLMLRVHGKVVRKGKSLTLMRHLVIDEAQDLAPVEIELLGHALWPDATATVAGDAAQQSDPSVAFLGWDDLMQRLAVADIAEARLTTNYRCPRPIAEFGHAVLGSLAPKEAPKAQRAGRPVTVSRFVDTGLAVASLSEALARLTERERTASVAVVCANEENARRWYEGLSNVAEARLVLDGEFEFRPGVDVTDVANVKGLEFDYVIIPDATAESYPDSPVARRALHIAVTRAVHQLWVMGVGRISPVLPTSATT
jgi:DNA helicase-2/ATP-dependent DNA helicase PcrA